MIKWGMVSGFLLGWACTIFLQALFQGPAVWSPSTTSKIFDQRAVYASKGNSTREVKLDLQNEVVGDRSVADATLDLHYALYLNETAFVPRRDATYDEAMAAFHGKNIWTDPNLDTMIDLWSLRKGNTRGGSPISNIEDRIGRFLQTNKPRVIVEVGVFRGANSIEIAKRLDELDIPDAFIICIDTWLLDLRFVWPPEQQKGKTYFRSPRVSGHELMYFVFLANVMQANMTHRMIPLQTSSLNGALALMAKNIRPDFVYLDASHANPDVFLDLLNFWAILNPGGVVVTDDYSVASVRATVDSFRERFKDEILDMLCESNQCWIYKK